LFPLKRIDTTYSLDSDQTSDYSVLGTVPSRFGISATLNHVQM